VNHSFFLDERSSKDIFKKMFQVWSAEFEPHEASGFPQEHKLLSLCNGEATFHKFIIITMILPFPHDSAIRWEEVLRLLDYF